MLNICQRYAEEHNLVFSTDPVPAKSKTKCVYFFGRPVQYPDHPQLGGEDLPWVESVDQLEHTLHPPGASTSTRLLVSGRTSSLPGLSRLQWMECSYISYKSYIGHKTSYKSYIGDNFRSNLLYFYPNVLLE